MMILLSRITGKVVSAYTGSPSFAVFVEIACFNESATFVPAGITVVAGSALLVAAAVGAALFAGCAAFCAAAHDPRTIAPTPIIAHRIYAFPKAFPPNAQNP